MIVREAEVRSGSPGEVALPAGAPAKDAALPVHMQAPISVALPVLGEPVDFGPYPTHVRTIEYFEGPLLCEVERDGQTYVERWCTCHREGARYVERHFLTPSSPEAVAAYVAGKMTLFDLIYADTVFVADLEHDKPPVVRRCKFDELPQDYLPDRDCMYDPEWAPPAD